MDGTVFKFTYLNHNKIKDYIYTRENIYVAPNTRLRATEIDNRGIGKYTIDYWVNNKEFFRFVDHDADERVNIVEFWNGQKKLHRVAVRNIKDEKIKESIKSQYSAFMLGHRNVKPFPNISETWQGYVDSTFQNLRKRSNFDQLYRIVERETARVHRI